MRRATRPGLNHRSWTLKSIGWARQRKRWVCEVPNCRIRDRLGLWMDLCGFGSCSGLCSTLSGVARELYVASGKGSFHRVHGRRLGLDDKVWWLGADRFLDCPGV